MSEHNNYGVQEQVHLHIHDDILQKAMTIRLQEAECELNRAQVRVIMDSSNLQHQEIFPEKKLIETELSALVDRRLRLESKVQKMTAHIATEDY
jgi:hypothetical protein